MYVFVRIYDEANAAMSSFKQMLGIISKFNLAYVHTFAILLASKANISWCPGALMLKMVPSILLKSPQNSALTP